MSDRYHGSAYRSSGGRAPPYRDDHRRWPPARHHPRDEHDYPDDRSRGYDSRDSYAASSYYPGYSERPHGRRVHKTIPPPRPWDYSRRPPPRTEQERIELEREREAWEAKEEERYKQRMEERERERERERDMERAREWDRYGAYPGGRERDMDVYERERERERARHADLGPPGRRPRSRSPDPRYDPRGSWGRASVGSSEGRERELTGPSASAPVSADRPDQASAYPPRRSSPPLAPSSDAAVAAPPSQHADTPDGGSSASRLRDAASTDRAPSPPRGPSGFISTPPTGPRASRGGPPPSHPSSAFRAREGSGASAAYAPDREVSSFLSPSSGRFRGSGAQAYRGGHPFGRSRRDTYDYEEVGYAGSSPHDGYPGAAHLAAPRLSRTSSSQASTPALATAVASPSTLAPPATTTPRFSAAATLTPELDAELLALEAQRNAFVSSYVLGAKRASMRSAIVELKDAELDLAAASNRRRVVERALDVAKETADAYSLEENRKDELQRLIAQQLQQPQTA